MSSDTSNDTLSVHVLVTLFLFLIVSFQTFCDMGEIIVVQYFRYIKINVLFVIFINDDLISCRMSPPLWSQMS